MASLLDRFEVIDLLSQTTFSGIFYGFSLILGSTCIHKLLKELKSKHRSVQHSTLLLSHSLLLLVFASLVLLTNNWVVISAYISLHNRAPGQPLPYEVTLVMLNSVSQIAISCLVTALELWRVSVIWTASPYMLPIVSFFTVCYFTMAGLEIYELILYNKGVDQHALDLSVLWIGAVLEPFIGFILISGRIIYVRRRIASLLNGVSPQSSNNYTSAIAIITESYTLMVVFQISTAISTTIFNPQQPPVFMLFARINPYSWVIASFLVLYRVLQNRAWSPSTEHELTTLRWNNETESLDNASNV
ncbi:hypothetical protein NP233_g1980 [Leucocoprinus birnbaumii]|uniref:Uncharacterized protein n=1 Tax=Leucocoprinus birnbaumii TaxID=56174 RepID=A0AAD5YVA6_9AGAR|nr:hypothetical protein NP233_g1980 [Leucocoprinus birnbaumii]